MCAVWSCFPACLLQFHRSCAMINCSRVPSEFSFCPTRLLLSWLCCCFVVFALSPWIPRYTLDVVRRFVRSMLLEEFFKSVHYWRGLKKCNCSITMPLGGKHHCQQKLVSQSGSRSLRSPMCWSGGTMSCSCVGPHLLFFRSFSFALWHISSDGIVRVFLTLTWSAASLRAEHTHHSVISYFADTITTTWCTCHACLFALHQPGGGTVKELATWKEKSFLSSAFCLFVSVKLHHILQVIFTDHI